MSKRPRGGPPPGERLPQVPPEQPKLPSETIASIPDQGKVGESELLRSIDAKATELKGKLDTALQQKQSGERECLELTRLINDGTLYFLLGLKQSGERTMRNAVQLLPVAEQLPQGKYGIYGQEFVRAFDKCPPDSFRPVIEIDVKQAQQVEREGIKVMSKLKQIADLVVLSRMHEYVVRKTIPREAAPADINRPLLEWNYPSGLSPEAAADYLEERGVTDWRTTGLNRLYVLNEVWIYSASPAEDKAQYEQTKKSVGASADYQGPVCRYLELPDALVQAREQRWKDCRETKDSGRDFYAQDMLPVAQRTTKFFEDLLRHMVTKIIKGETYWGDAEGKPFKKE